MDPTIEAFVPSRGRMLHGEGSSTFAPHVRSDLDPSTSAFVPANGTPHQQLWASPQLNGTEFYPNAAPFAYPPNGFQIPNGAPVSYVEGQPFVGENQHPAAHSQKRSHGSSQGRSQSVPGGSSAHPRGGGSNGRGRGASRGGRGRGGAHGPPSSHARKYGGDDAFHNTEPKKSAPEISLDSIADFPALGPSPPTSNKATFSPTLPITKVSSTSNDGNEEPSHSGEEPSPVSQEKPAAAPSATPTSPKSQKKPVLSFARVVAPVPPPQPQTVVSSTAKSASSSTDPTPSTSSAVHTAPSKPGRIGERTSSGSSTSASTTPSTLSHSSDSKPASRAPSSTSYHNSGNRSPIDRSNASEPFAQQHHKPRRASAHAPSRRSEYPYQQGPQQLPYGIEPQYWSVPQPPVQSGLSAVQAEFLRTNGFAVEGLDMSALDPAAPLHDNVPEGSIDVMQLPGYHNPQPTHEPGYQPRVPKGSNGHLNGDHNQPMPNKKDQAKRNRQMQREQEQYMHWYNNQSQNGVPSQQETEAARSSGMSKSLSAGSFNPDAPAFVPTWAAAKPVLPEATAAGNQNTTEEHSKEEAPQHDTASAITAQSEQDAGTTDDTAIAMHTIPAVASTAETSETNISEPVPEEQQTEDTKSSAAPPSIENGTTQDESDTPAEESIKSEEQSDEQSLQTASQVDIATHADPAGGAAELPEDQPDNKQDALLAVPERSDAVAACEENIDPEDAPSVVEAVASTVSTAAATVSDTVAHAVAPIVETLLPNAASQDVGDEEAESDINIDQPQGDVAAESTLSAEPAEPAARDPAVSRSTEEEDSSPACTEESTSEPGHKEQLTSEEPIPADDTIAAESQPHSTFSLLPPVTVADVLDKAKEYVSDIVAAVQPAAESTDEDSSADSIGAVDRVGAGAGVDAEHTKAELDELDLSEGTTAGHEASPLESALGDEVDKQSSDVRSSPVMPDASQEVGTDDASHIKDVSASSTISASSIDSETAQHSLTPSEVEKVLIRQNEVETGRDVLEAELARAEPPVKQAEDYSKTVEPHPSGETTENTAGDAAPDSTSAIQIVLSSFDRCSSDGQNDFLSTVPKDGRSSPSLVSETSADDVEERRFERSSAPSPPVLPVDVQLQGAPSESSTSFLPRLSLAHPQGADEMESLPSPASSVNLTAPPELSRRASMEEKEAAIRLVQELRSEPPTPKATDYSDAGVGAAQDPQATPIFDMASVLRDLQASKRKRSGKEVDRNDDTPMEPEPKKERPSAEGDDPKKPAQGDAPSLTLSILSGSIVPRKQLVLSILASLGINFLLPFVNGVMLGFGEIFARDWLGPFFGFVSSRNASTVQQNQTSSSFSSSSLGLRGAGRTTPNQRGGAQDVPGHAAAKTALEAATEGAIKLAES